MRSRCAWCSCPCADELSAVLEAVLVLIDGSDGRIKASAADVTNFVTAALTPSRSAEMAERAKRLVADSSKPTD